MPRKAITVYPFYKYSIALWVLLCKGSFIAEKFSFMTVQRVIIYGGKPPENGGMEVLDGREILCGEDRG